MINIHAMNNYPLSRFVVPSLSQRLRVMPAVVVTGARQTGKSTLAHDLTPANRRFLSPDDLNVLDLARREPDALLTGDRHITFHEVQRESDLLHAVKRAIDRRCEPGRFPLIGCANLLQTQ